MADDRGHPARRAITRWLQIPATSPFPVVTAVAVGIAVVAAVAQYTFPEVVPVLERDPVQLARGQWWRVATPLLVQTLGWYQVVVNLVTLLLIGTVAEWLLGRWRWSVVAVGGTAGGQVAAYAWQEPGGGSSIAICGLAAGVIVALLTADTPPPEPHTYLTVGYVVALTGWAYGGFVTAGGACVVAGALLWFLRAVGRRRHARIALAASVACAVMLLGDRDLHGAALAPAMAVTAALLAIAGGPPQRGPYPATN